MKPVVSAAAHFVPMASAFILALLACDTPKDSPPASSRKPVSVERKSDATLLNPAPGSQFFIGANFWNMDWEGLDNYFASGVDFAVAKNPWRPELIQELAPYSVLRFMDWNLANNDNNPQGAWVSRKNQQKRQDSPVAFEWQIDLCNRAKKDCWLCVPKESDPKYWRKLAELIHGSLHPSLRVYVEWSNEVWNGGFPQHQYSKDRAKELGLPGKDPAAAYYVHGSVRLFEIFEVVFGKQNPRLVKVLAGQAAFTGPCEAHLLALRNAAINPKQTWPTVYAIAPYIGGKSIAELRDDIPNAVRWTLENAACARRGNLPLIAYEGGTDSFSLGDQCAVLQQHPAMQGLYVSYLEALGQASMTGPFMQYTHTGACWGLKRRTGDPLESSPKYRGVLDWLSRYRPPSQGPPANALGR